MWARKGDGGFGGRRGQEMESRKGELARGSPGRATDPGRERASDPATECKLKAGGATGPGLGSISTAPVKVGRLLLDAAEVGRDARPRHARVDLPCGHQGLRLACRAGGIDFDARRKRKRDQRRGPVGPGGAGKKARRKRGARDDESKAMASRREGRAALSPTSPSRKRNCRLRLDTSIVSMSITSMFRKPAGPEWACRGHRGKRRDASARRVGLRMRKSPRREIASILWD